MKGMAIASLFDPQRIDLVFLDVDFSAAHVYSTGGGWAATNAQSGGDHLGGVFITPPVLVATKAPRPLVFAPADVLTPTPDIAPRPVIAPADALGPQQVAPTRAAMPQEPAPSQPAATTMVELRRPTTAPAVTTAITVLPSTNSGFASRPLSSPHASPRMS